MIKKIRVTVDGKSFDVTVEIPDDVQPAAPPPAAAPSPAVQPPPASPSSTATPAAAPAGAGDVPSPLSGHVVAIAVTIGQTVKKSDPLLTIEAMKMNTFVLAHVDGKVAALNVKIGEVVSDGQILVRIE